MSEPFPAKSATHEVLNQPFALADYNLFTGDAALREGVAREGADWASADLEAFGAKLGAADYLELGALANRYPPEFDTHDRYGRRVDLVRFHPAYHELMRVAIEHGLHASPWSEPREGAHVARAARFYMQTEVEAGHGCPITMTFAATPSLRLAAGARASIGCRRSTAASTIPATSRSRKRTARRSAWR